MDPPGHPRGARGAERPDPVAEAPVGPAAIAEALEVRLAPEPVGVTKIRHCVTEIRHLVPSQEALRALAINLQISDLIEFFLGRGRPTEAWHASCFAESRPEERR